MNHFILFSFLQVYLFCDVLSSKKFKFACRGVQSFMNFFLHRLRPNPLLRLGDFRCCFGLLQEFIFLKSCDDKKFFLLDAM